MSALREMYVGITLEDNASQQLQTINRRIDDFLSGLSGASNTVDNLGDALDDAGDEGQSAFNQLNSGLNTTEQNLEDAAESADDLGNELHTAGEEGVGAAGTMSSAFGRLAGIIASVFAVDKIKDFSISLIESAAEAQALSAQFEQVFGADAGEARGVVENLGKEFGMLPNRIKPAFTQMTSMFKGLGLETGEAMDTAYSAVTLVADAAAFYDKSFEDANASLNSFIKGNYEGGESIGLFANETQLAAWASKELKVDWKELGEAGKQTARLEFAKAMQEAAGATGQASRESDGYQNQLGNLQQSWTDLKTKLGEPILAPAISGLQRLTEKIQGVNTDSIINGFKIFGTYMSETFGPVIDDIKLGVSTLYQVFEENGGVAAAKLLFDGIKSGLLWIRDNSEVITAGLAGITGAFAAFKIITGINAAIGIFNTLMIAMRTGTLMATLAQWGLNTAMLASPLTWVVVGIGAVIAAGVLLWKNWDTVKAKAQALWEVTKQVFGKFKDYITEKLEPLINLFSNLKAGWDKFKNSISNFKMPKIGMPKFLGGNGFIQGSHATGLARVPQDGYVAELHQDEAVLTAEQSNALRGAGILKENANGTPALNVGAGGGSGTVAGAGSPKVEITNYVTFELSGSGNTESDIVRVAKRVWDETWESLNRINPQTTEG